MLQHRFGTTQNIFGREGFGQIEYLLFGIISRHVIAASQHKNRQSWKTQAQFCNKDRPADPGHVMARDNQTQFFGEMRQFDKAQGLGGARYPFDIGKPLF